MAILRKHKTSCYTVIDNGIFKDRNLSLKAKGLLCLMLSLPDKWSFSIEGLSRLSTDGKASVQSTLNELRDAGYFYRVQVRDGNRISGIEYVISEAKLSDFQDVENQDIENQDIGNQSQLNTNKSSNKKSITKDMYKGLPENLVSTLNDFEEMRKRIKAPLGDRARQMLLNKLDKLAGDNTDLKIEILEQSIFNSWKGVFAIDNRRSDQQRSRVSGTAGTGSGGNKGSGRRLPPVEKSLLEDFGS